MRTLILMGGLLMGICAQAADNEQEKTERLRLGIFFDSASLESIRERMKTDPVGALKKIESQLTNINDAFYQAYGNQAYLDNNDEKRTKVVQKVLSDLRKERSELQHARTELEPLAKYVAGIPSFTEPAPEAVRIALKAYVQAVRNQIDQGILGIYVQEKLGSFARSSEFCEAAKRCPPSGPSEKEKTEPHGPQHH